MGGEGGLFLPSKLQWNPIAIYLNRINWYNNAKLIPKTIRTLRLSYSVYSKCDLFVQMISCNWFFGWELCLDFNVWFVQTATDFLKFIFWIWCLHSFPLSCNWVFMYFRHVTFHTFSIVGILFNRQCEMYCLYELNESVPQPVKKGTSTSITMNTCRGLQFIATGK